MVIVALLYLYAKYKTKTNQKMQKFVWRLQHAYEAKVACFRASGLRKNTAGSLKALVD